MADRGEGDDIAFVKEAFAGLATRRLLLPALLLAMLMAAAKLALMWSLPSARHPDHQPYLLAFMLMVLATLALVVAILRILNKSARPLWQPDSSLWLYSAAFIVSASVALLVDMAVVGGLNDQLSGLAGGALDTALRAPFAAWFVAIAVERPLAWRPGPWFRRLRMWLPSFLLWSLLIVVPLRQIQLMLNWTYLVAGTNWFWPAALPDGLLGAAIELVSLALASVAYRRVARS